MRLIRTPKLRALGLVVALAVGLVRQSPGDVIPPADGKPVLDGNLDDACWASALVLTNFSMPLSRETAPQATEVRVCYNARFFYVAATCAESDTNRIAAIRLEENDNIWQDDCFELWIRDPTDNSRFDHFVTTPLGVRETHLKPLPDGTIVRPQWKVASQVTNGAWVAELAIPFSDLGRESGPVPGEVFQFKFGREDYTKGERGASFSIWPPRVAYGSRGEFGQLHVEREGLVQNPTLSADTNGVVAHWGVSSIPGFLQSTVEDDVPVAVFSAPGYYAYAEQMLKLPRNRLFSLMCETRGTSGGYIRARTGQAINGRVTTMASPSDEWQPREVLFQTDASGKATIIFGMTIDNEPGIFKVRNVQLREEMMRDFMGEAIPVDPDDESELVIKALRPTDCRILRGFCFTPVDGTTESWDWAMRPWEYNMSGTGTGVQYGYLKNDGLHIMLEDAKGVNAVQVRGGVHANVFTGCTTYDDPGSGTAAFTFEGRARNSLAYFSKPFKAEKFSFFDVRDGVMADVNFFRVGERRPKGRVVTGHVLLAGGKPGVLQAPLDNRFGRHDDRVYALSPGLEQSVSEDDAHSVSGRVEVLKLRNPTHFISAAVEQETPVGAIGLRGRWTRSPGNGLLTIQVQDPLHTFSAITTVSVALKSDGECNLVIDFPDQVLELGQALWISVIPYGAHEVRDLQIDTYLPEREVAVGEALPYQQLRFKHHFGTMSEGRPWTHLYHPEDLYTTWKAQQGKDWPGLEAMLNALFQCRRLDPADPLSTEYERWIFRASREKARQPVLDAPVLPPANGAPEWAVLAREAWLGTRSVADWWIQNRVVPTGEFGTELNDDTDLWQNFANFPMFERDGVGGELLLYGQRHWDLAVNGGYLEAGVNAHQDDPLHAYEEGINHEGMLMWWNFGDPVFVEQCMTAARSTESFTTVNAAGHRHFKSSIVSSADLRNQRPNEADGDNHSLLMHPVQEVVWYNRNPRALKFLTDYCDAWLAHIDATNQYPTLIDVDTDEVLQRDSEPFTESMSFQMGVMLTAAEAHGDMKFIRPAIEYFVRQGHPDFLRSYLADFYDQGYLGDIGPLRGYLFTYAPVTRWWETGDKRPIMDELRTEIAEIQTFRNMYTTVEPFADRVFLEAKRKLNTSSLAYTGGFATRNRSRHSHGVSWENFGTNYAALVRTSRRDRFETLVYNFNPSALQGQARFWKLDHGVYQWESGIDSDGDDAIDQARMTNEMEVVRGDRVPVTLAPQAVTVLRLTKLLDLDRLEDRADLALAPSEVAVVGETVRGLAHNIGSKDVDDVVVSLVDETGTVRMRTSLGALAAPVDLVPRRAPFMLEGLPEGHTGWQIVLDPDKVIPEITKINNSVDVP
ncbi:MAG: hypothetical protein K8T26_00275 [Lentisphaerae bacterium]|nr:hypothetical protein [Lentisphaerota bacterium]